MYINTEQIWAKIATVSLVANRNLTIPAMASVEAMKKELEQYQHDIDLLEDIVTNMKDNADKVGSQLTDQIQKIKEIVDKEGHAIGEIDGAGKGAREINESKQTKVQYISWILTLIFLVLIFVLQFTWKTH